MLRVSDDSYRPGEAKMSDKKLGRRVAGSWGRPGSRRQKRAASKASRRNGKRLVRA